MSISRTSTIQDLAGMPVKFILDQIEQKLQTVFAQAAQELRLPIFEIGQQIVFTLNHARIVYDEEMEKTIDKVDTIVSRNIMNIVQSALEFEQRTLTDVTTTLEVAQTAINAIPFSNKKPQLTRVTPQFYALSPTQNNQIFTFRGNFPNIASQSVILSLGDKTYNPIATSVTYIRFNIPYDDLPPGDMDRLNYISGKLNFWARSWFFWFSNAGSYPVYLGCLPPSPGRIELITTPHASQRVERDATSPTFRQSSSRHESNQDLNKPYQVYPTEGWRIVKDSPRLQTISTNRPHDKKSTPRGNWRHHKESETEQSVVFRVQTKRLNHGNSGDVTFRIHFKEYQYQNSAEQQRETLTLGWGESQDCDIQSNNYTVCFTAFDGSISNLTGANLTNRYITVHPRQNGVIITVKNPSDLSFN